MKTNLFDLKGKKAIITGATGGIGFACAEGLVRHGAQVLLLGRNQKKLSAAQKTLTKISKAITGAGGVDAVEILQVDLIDIKSMGKLFREHRLGKYSILVNSVGVNYPSGFLAVEADTYDAIMDANIKSAFFQTQFFVAAHMKEAKKNKTIKQQEVSIIHISSQMGHVGGFERSVYCASKHALEGFVKSTSLEIGKWNMRINSIAPTFIKTEMTHKTLSNPKKKKMVLDSIPLNRIGEVEDIMGAVVYLASSASKMVTGTSLLVDGGWTAR